VNSGEALDALRQEPDVDVLIIGGGINGVGTFRDLALQGVNVVLAERRDFCSRASAASSHMAHGGIRYLENGEFRLVRERNRMLLNAPHYVKPLPMTIPKVRFTGTYYDGQIVAPERLCVEMIVDAEADHAGAGPHPCPSP
jgi:glycerol-3-phosphate dehydrogenase